MKRWVVGDFETASSCNLKKSGAARYSEDPGTEILCFAYGNLDFMKVWMPSVDIAAARALAPFILEPAVCARFLAALCENTDDLFSLAADPDVVFIAHNTGFEKSHWRNIMEPDFGAPPIPNERWHDTMAVAAHKALPQELDTLCRVLKIGQGKDNAGKQVTLGMSKPDKKGRYDRSLAKRIVSAAYCLQDTVIEILAHKRLGWLPPKEREIWLLNQTINERGIKLDMDYVKAAQKIVDDASGPLLVEFARITGGLTPTQGAKFLAWLHREGIHLDNLQKETIAEMIGDDEAEDSDVPGDPLPSNSNGFSQSPGYRALRIRQLTGSSSVKKLKRMDQCVSFDGRARGLSCYHGSAPGRNTGRLLQPYNFPRGTVTIEGHDGKKKAPPPEMMVDAIMTGDYQYVEEAIGPAVETVVSSLRHSLVADRGRVFLSGDYAGIQARVVLAAAGQRDKLKLFSDDRKGLKGEDIYCSMASQIYKVPVLANDKVRRQTGKNSVLGLGFQMGAPKFQLKYAKNETLEFCQGVVYVYRKEFAPKVPELWYGLSDAAVRCVHTGETTESHGIEYKMENGALSARLPSGRKIWYQGAYATREVMPWTDDNGRAVHKAGFRYHVMKAGQWKEVKAFGGLLTENVVMGIEVDIQRRAQQLCEAHGMPVVLEVYDEVVVEPELVNADEKAFTQILLDVEPWVDALEIPIAIECWQGPRYKK